MPPTDPRTTYRERLARDEREAKRWDGRSRALSWTRLATASVGLAGFGLSVARASADPTPWLALFGVAVVAFVALVAVHDRVIRTRDGWRDRARVQRESLARLDRRWGDLSLPDVDLAGPGRSLGRDLHLVGRASLAQLLGSTHSPPGRSVLAAWLASPADPARIEARQTIVAALAPAVDFRQSLEVEARRLAGLAPDVTDFLAWAEASSWAERNRWTVRLAWGVPATAWLGAGLAGVGLIPGSVALGLFAISFFVANAAAARVDAEHERVSAREREMGTYASALGLLWSSEADTIEASALGVLRADLSEGGRSAAEHLAALQRLTTLADARRSGSLRFVLDTLFQWDVHTAVALDRWRRRAGSRVRAWLERLGEIEMLAALGGLAFDEPGWVMPRVDSGTDRLRAEGLAHPLLAATERIANDVEVGPAGTVLFVTGSNMSGKSTLLRAIGVNAVLAQMGGPVCARSLSMPPVELATSVRVEDSLEAGVSLFMAEVLRVREVIGAAERAAGTDRRLLFLLDEILQHTNSADRTTAVREVLRRLVDLGALGAVSSHDLALARDAELAPALVPVHLREEIHPDAAPGEAPMTFDYVLRPGVAQTTNALRLLHLFGLRADADHPADG